MKGLLNAVLIVGCDTAITPTESCPRLLIFNGAASWPIADQDRTIRASGFEALPDGGHACPQHRPEPTS